MDKFINRCTFLAILAAVLYLTIFGVIFLMTAITVAENDLTITKEVCYGLGILFSVCALPFWFLLLKAIRKMR